MSIGTKNGSVVLKGGSVAAGCCCDVWVCQCNCGIEGYAEAQMPYSVTLLVSGAPAYPLGPSWEPDEWSLNGVHTLTHTTFDGLVGFGGPTANDGDRLVCCKYAAQATARAFYYNPSAGASRRFEIKGNKLFAQLLCAPRGSFGQVVTFSYESPSLSLTDAICRGQFPDGTNEFSASAGSFNWTLVLP